MANDSYRAFIESRHEGILRFDIAPPMPLSSSEDEQVAGFLERAIVGEHNRAMAAMYGVTDLLGRRAADLDLPADVVRAFIHSGHQLVDFERRTADARCFVHSLTGIIEDGQLAGAWAVQRDDTQRIRMAEELQLSERRLRSLFGAMSDVILVLDREGRYREIAPTNPSLLYRPAPQMLGKKLHEVFPAEQAEYFLGIVHRVLASRANADLEYRLEIGGREVWFSATVSPLSADSVTWVARDISEHKIAEAARVSMEAQLRQAQKMEAVGRLASGIAHDFNNLLSVVMSYGQMIAADLKPRDPMRLVAEEICKAGERASTLTRQLLAFSRQQVLEPEVLDLNQVTRGLEGMLRRILGEDIEFELELAPKIDPVLADPGQMEQVLMNLVVNARDAMPQGGRLTVETANVVLDPSYAKIHLEVTPGPYVMLSVTDNGVGMSREVQAHIFEPFFSTKEKGKGTGLGLSTVFGIVRQSGGSINVWSEPGKGARFDIYLPRETKAAKVGGPARASIEGLRGSETVLLVEDEDQVRALAMNILRRYGYSVLEASNAGEALLLCEEHKGPIDLLLTDVVMPQMSGVRLAKRLLKVRPSLKILCMSGYASDESMTRGIAEEGLAFLQKPLTPEQLVRRVREVLEA